jgi:rfaE bifunctional protein nucleotidyltransferase chain/domain
MSQVTSPEKSCRAVERKLMNRADLAEAIRSAKQQGKSVVFTNGCFDILHIGHVRYLQDARSQGDLLVVGVNSDASVSRLKGPGRPVVREEERVEILAALECVDYVTIFSEDTPVELILAIKPNIHVKGGDYKPEDLPEADAVESVGGEVRIVSYTSTETEGWSTTNLIGRIVQNRNG